MKCKKYNLGTHLLIYLIFSCHALNLDLVLEHRKQMNNSNNVSTMCVYVLHVGMSLNVINFL